jgi:predicted transcriptional regulator
MIDLGQIAELDVRLLFGGHEAVHRRTVGSGPSCTPDRWSAENGMLEPMVTMNIQVDEELFSRIRELAKKTGRTAEQAATELLASLSAGEIELDAEQDAAVAEGMAQLDRGEFVTESEVMAKLKALRR